MEWEVKRFNSEQEFIEEGMHISHVVMVGLRRDPKSCRFFNQTLGMMCRNILEDEVIMTGSDQFRTNLIEKILLDSLDRAMFWHCVIGKCNSRQFYTRHSIHVQLYKNYIPKR